MQVTSAPAVAPTDSAIYLFSAEAQRLPFVAPTFPPDALMEIA
jgi:hypothetical protein